MANIKSAKKRAIQAEKRRIRNKSVKTNLKTTEKKFMKALETGDAELSEQAFRLAVKKYDMAAAKGVIHKNNASNKKSKLARRLNAFTSAKDAAE
jgi:small subunit ribosomal protein S20